MQKLLIKKGKPLKGTIRIGGSKNSALPILVSSLLSNKECKFLNIPNLTDIKTMVILLNNLGVSCNRINNEIILNGSSINNFRAEYDLVRKMRASILVLGPLLTRIGKAIVSLPGGCSIGTRPIDLHLFGMKKLGAKITIKNGYVYANAPKGLVGNKIILPSISVGATENIILAATLAKGTTTIKNAAKEPEVEDLSICLNKMGAKIKGAGTSVIKIKGVSKLNSVEHSIIPDRIVAGTYIIAALITRGKLKVTNMNPEHLKIPIKILNKMGARLIINKDSVEIDGKKSRIKPINISTKPYPGFPTDLQAQLMTLLAITKGKSIIHERIFENRFLHVSELNRLGAMISVKKDKSLINGVRKLIGAPIMASDLRASVSLVLAGLIAEGETKIHRIYHLDRGYENIEENLNLCGSNIQRIR